MSGNINASRILVRKVFGKSPKSDAEKQKDCSIKMDRREII
jgi:hypothetical protein